MNKGERWLHRVAVPVMLGDTDQRQIQRTYNVFSRRRARALGRGAVLFQHPDKYWPAGVSDRPRKTLQEWYELQSSGQIAVLFVTDSQTLPEQYEQYESERYLLDPTVDEHVAVSTIVQALYPAGCGYDNYHIVRDSRSDKRVCGVFVATSGKPWLDSYDLTTALESGNFSAECDGWWLTSECNDQLTDLLEHGFVVCGSLDRKLELTTGLLAAARLVYDPTTAAKKLRRQAAAVAAVDTRRLHPGVSAAEVIALARELVRYSFSRIGLPLHIGSVVNVEIEPHWRREKCRMGPAVIALRRAFVYWDEFTGGTEYRTFSAYTRLLRTFHGNPAVSARRLREHPKLLIWLQHECRSVVGRWWLKNGSDAAQLDEGMRKYVRVPRGRPKARKEERF